MFQSCIISFDQNSLVYYNKLDKDENTKENRTPGAYWEG